MNPKDRIIIVTGGKSGIGAALVRAFLRGGARAVYAADLRADAPPTGAIDHACDVTDEESIKSLIKRAETEHGKVDIFCSNAGVLTPGWDLRDADFTAWQRDFSVNVLAHAFAAKAVLPGMIARKEGYLLNTASAAGLLASPESAIYTLTKHAAVGLAEYLAFTYARFGIRVSALCPMAVRTPMLEDLDTTGGSAGLDGILDADAVAAATLAGMEDERFLILPHPTVAEYWAKKAARPDRWLSQMEKLSTHFNGTR
jgi:NAD(P)-dependent dehydrogenase (short-subunit alcohol dehydrogenase family)